jgi:hypothetical protein
MNATAIRFRSRLRTFVPAWGLAALALASGMLAAPDPGGAPPQRRHAHQ